MATSTLTEKGQTTVPQEIRDALKVKARQQLTWSLSEDGTAVVRPQPSALDLFASLRSPKKKFQGRDKEREAVARAIGRRAARKSGR